MNIFYLDPSPTISAIYQPDKMLVKMVLESAQMLSTAHRVLDGEEKSDELNLYKKTHYDHPCNIWVRETSGNYLWLYFHFLALGEEYKYRYNKEHKSISKLAYCLSETPKNISSDAITPHKLCMPDEYKSNDLVQSYRRFVIATKDYAKWENGRDKPTWWIN
jgi:hypothetical protein